MSILSDTLKKNRASNLVKMQNGSPKKQNDVLVSIANEALSPSICTATAKSEAAQRAKENNDVAFGLPEMKQQQNNLQAAANQIIKPQTESELAPKTEFKSDSGNDDKKGKFKDFIKNNTGLSQGIGQAADLAATMVDTDEDSGFGTQQAIGDVLMKSGNPYAMAAGAAVKALSVTSQALGINQNTIDKKLGNWAGVSKGARALNNINAVLDFGGLTGALTKKTDEFDKAEELDELSNSYAGALNNVNMASSAAGKRYAIGRNKINTKIKEAQRQQDMLLDAKETNTLRQKSDYGNNLIQQNLNRYSGNDYSSMAIGKNGMALPDKESVRNILAARAFEKWVREDWNRFVESQLQIEAEKEIPEFKEGGKLNVLPDGALHANLNHIDDSESKIDVSITKKGIPVVSKDENGNIEQCAEIERQELVLNYDLTKFIEDKLKQYNASESEEEKKKLALEVGIELSNSIIKETQDEAKFMNTIKV